MFMARALGATVLGEGFKKAFGSVGDERRKR
jgi:hypothetical protein